MANTVKAEEVIERDELSKEKCDGAYYDGIVKQRRNVEIRLGKNGSISRTQIKSYAQGV